VDIGDKGEEARKSSPKKALTEGYPISRGNSLPVKQGLGKIFQIYTTWGKIFCLGDPLDKNPSFIREHLGGYKTAHFRGDKGDISRGPQGGEKPTSCWGEFFLHTRGGVLRRGRPKKPCCVDSHRRGCVIDGQTKKTRAWGDI